MGIQQWKGRTNSRTLSGDLQRKTRRRKKAKIAQETIHHASIGARIVQFNYGDFCIAHSINGCDNIFSNFALFWIFSIPLVYLKYFIIIIGMHMLFMIGTMVFLWWNDFMFYFEHLLYLLDNFGWYFWLVLRFCVLNYVLCISCVNDTYKALWLCLINSCTLKVYIFIKRKIYNI